MADLIERDRLIELIEQLNPYNNNDCPQWVVDIINGLPNHIRQDEDGTLAVRVDDIEPIHKVVVVGGICYKEFDEVKE